MNKTLSRLTSAFLITLVFSSAPAQSPPASVIGVQFTGNQYTGGGASLLAPADSAGLPGSESKHFNAFNLDQDGNALADAQLEGVALVQDTAGAGSPTSAKLTTAGFTDVLLTGANNVTANEKMYKHALAVLSRAPSATVKVSGLAESGYGAYDLIVYLAREFFGGNPAINASLEVNGRAPVEVQVPHYPTNTALVFQDGTDGLKTAVAAPVVQDDGRVAVRPDAGKNTGVYARFTGLSGDLALTLHSAIGGTIGIGGFQIIKTSDKAPDAPLAAAPKAGQKNQRKAMPSDILVVSPAYGSDVKGDTRVVIDAPSYKNVTVHCWKQGAGFGEDSTVAQVGLDADGKGSFNFPADEYPHGPVTLRISGVNGEVKDNCYLQLYNTGGVSWNEGLPEDPPGAKGLKLVFADDFTGPLSIGNDAKSTYYAHKPPNGAQDFSSLPFTDFSSPGNPFKQVDTYLRIRASEKVKSSGIITPVKPDGSGLKVSAPAYFECRFVGPNAPGSWPSFWLLTDPDARGATDELDIIEAYGGEGPGHPNAGATFRITAHPWGQGKDEEALRAMFKQGVKNPVQMSKFGIPSSWYEASHTYGCLITETETVYYCDNIEVGRHPTYPLSKVQPIYFLIDLATSGGWPVDLSRYGGTVDMYVDFVRVYAGQK